MRGGQVCSLIPQKNEIVREKDKDSSKEEQNDFSKKAGYVRILLL